MESLPEFSSSSTADNHHRRKTTTQSRNLLDLPEELQSRVFEKLGPFDIIRWAKPVCSLWRNLAKQPHLFRSIHLAHSLQSDLGDIEVLMIEKEMIDRSAGQLVSLSYDDWCVSDSPAILCYAFAKPNFLNSLKFLEIKCTGVECFMNAAIGKLPSLEKLTLSLHKYNFEEHTPEQVIAEIGTSCSLLKYFRWERNSHHAIRESDDYAQYEDTQVLAIAKYMSQLQELHLENNIVTDKELHALLDGCPNLEHLDLERCDYLTDLSRDLLKHCWKRIKTFSPPKERFSRFYESNSPAYQTRSPGYEPISPGYDPYYDSTSPGHGIFSDEENSHILLPSSPVYGPTSPYYERYSDKENSLTASPSYKDRNYFSIGSPRI